MNLLKAFVNGLLPLPICVITFIILAQVCLMLLC